MGNPEYRSELRSIDQSLKRIAGALEAINKNLFAIASQEKTEEPE